MLIAVRRVLLRKSDFMFVAGQFSCRNRESLRGQLCQGELTGGRGLLGKSKQRWKVLKAGSQRVRLADMRCCSRSQPSPQTVLELQRPGAELFLLEASIGIFCVTHKGLWGVAVTLAPGWGCDAWPRQPVLRLRGIPTQGSAKSQAAHGPSSWFLKVALGYAHMASTHIPFSLVLCK